MTIPTTRNEQARLNALRDLRLLDTPPSESFDRITRLASQVFDLPISAVSLTDSDRQWFKSRVGVAHGSISRREAPCARVAESCGTLVIEDLLSDPGYRGSPLARSGIRFYAGAPLITRDGFGLGAMCVLGTEPRTATTTEISSLEDLAAMVMAQIELQHAFGRVDPVSGLPNRTQFLEDLEDLAKERGAGEGRLATVIDLIAAEQLNHVLRVMGPGPVDAMIKTAARNLSEMIGPGRKAYHVGSSQLAVVSPAGLDEAGYIALMKTKGDRMRALAGSGAVGSVALGVAPFKLGKTSGADVLRIAQSAVQDARTSGELFSFYSSRQDLACRRRFRLLQEFEIAIETSEQFSLVYQPRIDVASGRCVGAEALMRWHHPTLGMISPAEFVPLIEQMALSEPMTAWVIRTAVGQLSRWRRSGMTLPISINVSPANLREADFSGSVLRALAEHDVPTWSLELEITETAIMNDAGHARAQLEKLAGAGIRLAIDDFGTGYSSLSHLQKLPIRVVKIDRSFMQDLDTNPKQMPFVSMMIDMSKHLGHRVVAEGIETEQVLARLRMTACDEVQGFLFARPMPADQFEVWSHAR